MDEKLIALFDDAIWVGKALFYRNKVSGSSANMSFLYKDNIYITRSGSCFGNLKVKDFAKVDFYGNTLNNILPSKELKLHIILYNKKGTQIKAIVHTHSFYSTMWSMAEHKIISDIMPSYTPYLKMKLGKVGLIEYKPPGSEELFEVFKEKIEYSDGFILSNHGPIIGSDNILDVFYILEELEESSRIALELRDKNIKALNSE